MFHTERSQTAQRFRDRREAGRKLGRILAEHVVKGTPLVLGLPRGGVPVAYEVASLLGAKLDVFLVRKLGMPGQEEVAMGAIASGGGIVLNENLVQRIGLSQEEVDAVLHREKAELERREALYRDNRPFPEIRGQTVVLVDDGLATGASMLVALRALQAKDPFKVIVAVPVGSEDICRSLNKEADKVVCLQSPSNFRAVGEWYQNFSQTTDDEVVKLLQQAEG